MIGIENIGNSCFINSGIQFLYNIDIFKKYIIDNNFKKDINIKNNEKDEKLKLYKCVLLEFQELLINMDKECKDDIKNNIKNICLILQHLTKLDDYLASNISNLNIHNDVEEFINFIFDKIEDYTEYRSVELISTNQFYENFFKKKSIINKCFKIQQATQQKCLNCGYLSKLNFNNYINKLELSISEMSINSISESLNYYCKTRIMNEYHCDKCKQICKAKERTILSILPEYIIIQLLRFNNDGSKNTKAINIDKIIDFTKNTYDKKSSKYVLTTVSCHIDFNFNCGHYITFVNKNDSWYKIDDESVNITNNFDILTNNCYLLLYKKMI